MSDSDSDTPVRRRRVAAGSDTDSDEAPPRQPVRRHLSDSDSDDPTPRPSASDRRARHFDDSDSDDMLPEGDVVTPQQAAPSAPPRPEHTPRYLLVSGTPYGLANGMYTADLGGVGPPRYASPSAQVVYDVPKAAWEVQVGAGGGDDDSDDDVYIARYRSTADEPLPLPPQQGWLDLKTKRDAAAGVAFAFLEDLAPDVAPVAAAATLAAAVAWRMQQQAAERLAQAASSAALLCVTAAAVREAVAEAAVEVEVEAVQASEGAEGGEGAGGGGDAPGDVQGGDAEGGGLKEEEEEEVEKGVAVVGPSAPGSPSGRPDEGVAEGAPLQAGPAVVVAPPPAAPVPAPAVPAAAAAALQQPVPPKQPAPPASPSRRKPSLGVPTATVGVQCAEAAHATAEVQTAVVSATWHDAVDAANPLPTAPTEEASAAAPGLKEAFLDDWLKSDLLDLPIVCTPQAAAPPPPSGSLACLVASTAPRWAHPKALLAVAPPRGDIEALEERLLSAEQASGETELEQRLRGEVGDLRRTVAEQEARQEAHEGQLAQGEAERGSLLERVHELEEQTKDAQESKVQAVESRDTINQASRKLTAQLRAALEEHAKERTRAESLALSHAALTRQLADVSRNTDDSAALRRNVEALTMRCTALTSEKTKWLQRVIDLEVFLTQRKDLELSAKLRCEAGQRRELRLMEEEDGVAAANVLFYDSSRMAREEARLRRGTAQLEHLLHSEMSRRHSITAEYEALHSAVSQHLQTLLTAAIPEDEAMLRASLLQAEGQAFHRSILHPCLAMLSSRHTHLTEENAELSAALAEARATVAAKDDELAVQQIRYAEEVWAERRKAADNIKKLEDLLVQRATQYREEEERQAQRHKQLLAEMEANWVEICGLKDQHIAKLKSEYATEIANLREEKDGVIDILREEQKAQRRDVDAKSACIASLEAEVADLRGVVGMLEVSAGELRSKNTLLLKAAELVEVERDSLTQELEASRHELIEVNKLTIMAGRVAEDGLATQLHKAQADVMALQRKLIKQESSFGSHRAAHRHTVSELEGQIAQLRIAHDSISKTQEGVQQGYSSALDDLASLRSESLLLTAELESERRKSKDLAQKVKSLQAKRREAQEAARAQGVVSPAVSVASSDLLDEGMLAALALSPIAGSTATASPPLPTPQQAATPAATPREVAKLSAKAASLSEENLLLLQRIEHLEGAEVAALQRHNALREYFMASEAPRGRPMHMVTSRIACVRAGASADFDRLTRFFAAGTVDRPSSGKGASPPRGVLQEVAAIHGGHIRLVATDAAEHLLYLRVEQQRERRLGQTVSEAAEEEEQARYLVARLLHQFPSDVCQAEPALDSLLGVVEAARVAVLEQYAQQEEQLKELEKRERHVRRKLDKKSEEMAAVCVRLALANTSLEKLESAAAEQPAAEAPPLSSNTEVLSALDTLAVRMDECVASYAEHAKAQSLRRKKRLVKQRQLAEGKDAAPAARRGYAPVAKRRVGKSPPSKLNALDRPKVILL